MDDRKFNKIINNLPSNNLLEAKLANLEAKVSALDKKVVELESTILSINPEALVSRIDKIIAEISKTLGGSECQGWEEEMDKPATQTTRKPPFMISNYDGRVIDLTMPTPTLGSHIVTSGAENAKPDLIPTTQSEISNHDGSDKPPFMPLIITTGFTGGSPEYTAFIADEIEKSPELSVNATNWPIPEVAFIPYVVAAELNTDLVETIVNAPTPAIFNPAVEVKPLPKSEKDKLELAKQKKKEKIKAKKEAKKAAKAATKI